MDITPNTLPKALETILKAKLVPNILGSPGIGKSDIVREVANDFNLKLIDFRLSQADPTDLMGFPNLNEGRSDYAPPLAFPIEGDPLPEIVGAAPVKDEEGNLVPATYDGWLLFLDEFNSAPLSVQAAAYKLTLDRQIGQHKLHENTAIIAAGNKATDKAIVNRMSTAMQSRMVHFNLEVTHRDWLDWAFQNGIDHRITSFIEFRPEQLHRFNPTHADNTFPCPRTWAFLSKVLENTHDLNEMFSVIAAGTIGQGAAIEFVAFAQIYQDLPTLSDIIRNPTTIAISEDPAIKYALCGLIAHNSDPNNLSDLSPFVERLPLEFQILTWQTTIKRNPDVRSTEYIRGWIKNNAGAL